jgi:hypothetical protein
MEKFNLKKLNEVMSKEKECIEVTSRIEALQDLDVTVDINSAWETTRDFEDFTAVTMNNAVFWDIRPCGYCKNRHFRRIYRLHHQGNKNG